MRVAAPLYFCMQIRKPSQCCVRASGNSVRLVCSFMLRVKLSLTAQLVSVAAVLCRSSLRSIVLLCGTLQHFRRANSQPLCLAAALYMPLSCACLRVVLQSQGVPDVWLQVLVRCARDTDCVSEAVAQLESIRTAQDPGEPAAVPWQHAIFACTASATSCTELAPRGLLTLVAATGSCQQHAHRYRENETIIRMRNFECTELVICADEELPSQMSEASHCCLVLLLHAAVCLLVSQSTTRPC